MPIIELTVPAAALTAAGRASVQRELADALLRWEGAPEEQADGTWGADGRILREDDLADLVKAAATGKAIADA